MNFFKKVVEILGRNYITRLLLHSLKLPSAVILIVVNIIPLIGVIFFQWNAYDLVVLYWLENVVVGIYNVARMPFTKTPGQMPNAYGIKQSSLFSGISKIFYTIFFIIHFSGFTFIHGVFIRGLAIPSSTLTGLQGYKQAGIFFAALMISHGYSYFANFILKKEYKDRTIMTQMMQPYKRIFVLQFTIIFGILLAAIIPQTGLAIVLVLVKIVIDLGSHFKAHNVQILDRPDPQVSKINFIAGEKVVK